MALVPPPILPSYKISDWLAKPFKERLKMVCGAWATDGYGTPWPIYIVYILKIGFYISVWMLFCTFTPGYTFGNIELWWAEPIALQKAVLWSIAFEILGLGCGSGPLTGRYMPPFGGALYFLRPGTIKLPLFGGLPLTGGHKRTYFDVVLYLAFLTFLVRALIQPTLGAADYYAILILLPLMTLRDKTLFLAARGEHYFTACVVFAFAGADLIAGSKFVWLGIWIWAATSKVGHHHFPPVVAVMMSNSPVTKIVPWFRKAMYVNYPDDLRPSKLAKFMAHQGTVVEYSFPLVLLFSDGGLTTTIFLVVMLFFHIFITSSIPMGVPIEWNFIMVYGAFFLFGAHANVSAFSLGEPVVIGYLLFALLFLPLFGSFIPSKVSFLQSMRYYAGNWAMSVWLFKKGSSEKLDTHLVKASPLVSKQLAKFYDSDTVTAVISKVTAFRCMHIHGRTLQFLIPKAVDDIEDYEWMDGEIVAGIVLGWNFGDGHLHHNQLLQAVQEECQFEDGELRCIFVESQPLGGSGHAYMVADACQGVLETGQIPISQIVDLQPWEKL